MDPTPPLPPAIQPSQGMGVPSLSLEQQELASRIHSLIQRQSELLASIEAIQTTGSSGIYAAIERHQIPVFHHAEPADAGPIVKHFLKQALQEVIQQHRALVEEMSQMFTSKEDISQKSPPQLAGMKRGLEIDLSRLEKEEQTIVAELSVKSEAIFAEHQEEAMRVFPQQQRRLQEVLEQKQKARNTLDEVNRLLGGPSSQAHGKGSHFSQAEIQEALRGGRGSIRIHTLQEQTHASSPGIDRRSGRRIVKYPFAQEAQGGTLRRFAHKIARGGGVFTGSAAALAAYEAVCGKDPVAYGVVALISGGLALGFRALASITRENELSPAPPEEPTFGEK